MMSHTYGIQIAMQAVPDPLRLVRALQQGAVEMWGWDAQGVKHGPIWLCRGPQGRSMRAPETEAEYLESLATRVPCEVEVRFGGCVASALLTLRQRTARRERPV